MRISIAILILLAVSLSSCGSPKTAARFYHTHKHKEGVTNFKVPGWLIWMGGGIAQSAVKDPEAKAGLRLARKVKKLRFMATEDDNPITAAEVGDFITNIRSTGYEDLLSVREGRSTVHILSREKKEKLKNLLILVNDEEEFVFMDMKSRLKYEDLTDLANTILKSKEAAEQEQSEEPAEGREEEPVTAEKKPRA